jgi:Relaxase/Mobilisation nuclease domain
MNRRVIDLRSQGRPLLDIVSYARGRGPLTPDQRAYVARTVRRVPEVVVKVSGGARTLAGVERHMKYIEKKDEFGLETDMNTRASGQGFAHDLVRDWDLDVEVLNHYSKKSVRGKPPRLAHNIIFSMPAGTSPTKVLEAVRRVALNEWALEHRYAMALHTDTPRPHVHVVVKAVSEKGVRLNIKKDTLRNWRAQFAANLRELGVAANATERAVRGETRTHKRTAIYRPAQRNDSYHVRELQAKALREAMGELQFRDPGFAVLNQTRNYVMVGWRALEAKMRTLGDDELARDIGDFADQMSPVQTERVSLVRRAHDFARSRSGHNV